MALRGAIALVSSGPMTARDLARHVGRRVSVYEVRAEKLALSYRPEDVRNREAVTRVVRSTLRLAARDFEGAFARPGALVEGERRTLWAGRTLGWLTDAEVERVNRLVGELSELFAESRPGAEKRLCALTWTLAPLPDRS